MKWNPNEEIKWKIVISWDYGIKIKFGFSKIKLGKVVFLGLKNGSL